MTAPTLLLASFFAMVGCGNSSVDSMRSELARTEARLASVPAEGVAQPSRSSSVERDTPTGSLANFQAYAFAHSPALLASFEHWRAAVEVPRKERALPDPTITYAGFVSSVETRVGPMRHRLGVRQWFPWPTSVLARSDAAAERAEAAQRVFEAHALALGAEVGRVYWRLWLIEQEQQIQRRQVEVLRIAKQLAETLVETGTANVSALAQISLRIARHESHVARLSEETARASAKLAFTLGMQDTGTFQISANPSGTRLPSESFDTLAEDLSRHPRVESIISLSSAEDALVRAARGERAPRLGLGLDWTIIGDPATPVPDGGKDAVSINASISVPIWASGASAKARVARAKSRAHRAQAEHVRGLLRSDLRVLLTDLRGSARTIGTYQTQMIPQAIVAQESVYFAFEAGRVGVTDLLDTHGIRLELELELAHARYEHEVTWSDIEALVGRPVSERGDDDKR